MVSYTDSDHDKLRHSTSKENIFSNELSTDGAESLFSTVLTKRIKEQKVYLINYFGRHFIN